MISISLLFIITALVLLIALFLLSIGGTLFVILFADLIVAVFIIWLLFFRKKNKKK